jgi:ACT domain-containing protein
MKEKNLKRATQICSVLETYRKTIDKIDNVSSIETEHVEIQVKLKEKHSTYTITFSLGDEYIKWSLNREKMRLISRILELEAELRKL